MRKAEMLVAVSGGIDSVALLHMLVAEGNYELTVAHFDHGIRSDSAADARFVEGLAKRYSLPFVVKREELGKTASEETARNRRYAFLRAEADKRHAVIVTAHHADDVIETIAINVVRGTGWRGLAVMDTTGIARPLLGMDKSAIRDYALKHRLEWVEDSTNSEDRYLRNRMRRTIYNKLEPDKKRRILDIWRTQTVLRGYIDSEANSLLPAAQEYSRFLLIMVDEAAASELLRTIILRQAGISMTRPQLQRALLGVKTARPGARLELGAGVQLRFSQQSFVVETP